MRKLILGLMNDFLIVLYSYNICKMQDINLFGGIRNDYVFV